MRAKGLVICMKFLANFLVFEILGLKVLLRFLDIFELLVWAFSPFQAFCGSFALVSISSIDECS